ncbi:hypothetical protein M0R45_026401 [Rubus argutus]|uniref:Uncharacterized protein n=1 Tax=Rubus argutus TaxID=59490 RepID=A0AAW1X0X5_RUBAR
MRDCSRRRFSDESSKVCRSEHAEHLGDGRCRQDVGKSVMRLAVRESRAQDLRNEMSQNAFLLNGSSLARSWMLDPVGFI